MCLSKFLTNLPSIKLPSAVVEQVKAANPTMTGFHVGMPEFERNYAPPYVTFHTKPHDEKMMAYVCHPPSEKTAILFSCMGMTNFSEINIWFNGIHITCVEQLFKLSCASMHREKSPNAAEVMFNILTAPTPVKAKVATFKLQNFDLAERDKASQSAMKASIAFACTDEKTFARFQRLGNLAGLGNLAKVVEVKVFECNDDQIWGINRFTKQILDALQGGSPCLRNSFAKHG